MSTQCATHNYTVRTFGHDYSIRRVRQDGMVLDAIGWGQGITTDDYLILSNGGETTRYRVESIRYLTDPTDMWSATLVFSPRK